MTCGCSSQKKNINNNQIPENYQISPSLRENKKECKNNGYGVNFMYREPGYRQATKCPCPFEYPSNNTPRIPFI